MVGCAATGGLIHPTKLFQQGKRDDGFAKYKEIIEKYYAALVYRDVKQALDQRKWPRTIVRPVLLA